MWKSLSEDVYSVVFILQYYYDASEAEAWMSEQELLK